ncbi:MAG TPA: hypothetical protein VMI52_08955 [Acetobacteraceae bacterium]|nr:hypothetical protein [Acetobacteraceae bacterium]
MTEWINAANDWVLYALIVLFIGMGVEGGAAFARWRRMHNPDDADRFLSTLAAPTIGLLALMIGFTFSMALMRFEDRKTAVVEEANAIGTAALRGQMLPQPYSSAVAPLFKEYALLRVRRGGETFASPAVMEVIRRSVDIQGKLWREAMEAAAANPQVVPTGLFVQALNSMIDMHETRLTAGRNHVPVVVFIMLEGVAIVAHGFAGYGEQWAGAWSRAGLWIMAVMIGSVIMLIVDLDRPQAGFITVDQQPLLDLIEQMK